jgi:hypothetical protein
VEHQERQEMKEYGPVALVHIFVIISHPPLQMMYVLYNNARLETYFKTIVGLAVLFMLPTSTINTFKAMLP